MGDRNLLRDKTLLLRIQDDELLSRVRDKIAKLETQAGQQLSKATSPKSGTDPSSRIFLGSSFSSSSSGSAVSPTSEGRVMDLAGIHVEPAIQSRKNNGRRTPTPTLSSAGNDPNDNANDTYWKFFCDSKVYPARLVNLPCPVELLKTHDRAMYYKTVDVCQLLIVYRDRNEMKEADDMLESMQQKCKGQGFPSYFHSGITLPLVVEKRFSKREHALKAPPPFEEIRSVEDELIELINKVSKDAQKKSGASTTTTTNKLLEQIEDVVVDYEPWMDDSGNIAQGIEFNSTSTEYKKHPEVWLEKEDIEEHEEEERQQQEKDQLKKEQEQSQKEKKKKKKKTSLMEDLTSVPISRNTNILDVNDDDDEVTKAAKQIAEQATTNIIDDDLDKEILLDDQDLEFNDFFDLGLELT